MKRKRLVVRELPKPKRKPDALGLRPKHRSHTWGMYPENTLRIPAKSFPPKYIRGTSNVRYIDIPDIVAAMEQQITKHQYQRLMFYGNERPQYPITATGTDLPYQIVDNVVIALSLFSGPILQKWNGQDYVPANEGNQRTPHIGVIDQLYALMRGEITHIEYFPTDAPALPVTLRQIAPHRCGLHRDCKGHFSEEASFRDNLR